MLPRVPFTGGLLGVFQCWARVRQPACRVRVGRALAGDRDADEDAVRQNGHQVDDRTLYRVEKMKWAGNARTPDKSVIVYNDYFTLSHIPLEAYDYVVNGKSAIEWVMERYAVTQDKVSRIVERSQRVVRRSALHHRPRQAHRPRQHGDRTASSPASTARTSSDVEIEPGATFSNV